MRLNPKPWWPIQRHHSSRLAHRPLSQAQPSDCCLEDVHRSGTSCIIAAHGTGTVREITSPPRKRTSTASCPEVRVSSVRVEPSGKDGNGQVGPLRATRLGRARFGRNRLQRVRRGPSGRACSARPGRRDTSITAGRCPCSSPPRWRTKAVKGAAGGVQPEPRIHAADPATSQQSPSSTER